VPTLQQDDRASTPVDTGDSTPRRQIDRRLVIVGGLLILSYIGGLIGLALLPLLASEQPLLLMMIYPVSGALFLIAPQFDPVFFVALASARRLIVHVLFFLLGGWYGERAIRWTTQRGGGEVGGFVATVQGLFGRFGWLIVLIFPGPLPSVLAGTTRMSWPLFIALDLIGTVVSVAIVRVAASAASGPLATALRFIDENSRWLTIITVLATVAWVTLRGIRPGVPTEEDELPQGDPRP
jgi:membrane protein DedA with SNARE-associated domain